MSSTAIDKNKDPANAHISIPAGQKKKLKGALELSLEQEVTLVITGKLNSFSKSDWDKSTNFTVNISSCEFKTKEKKVSMARAMDRAEKRV